MEENNLNNVSDLEDGEILNDDPVELYTPLERPHIPSTVDSEKVVSNESESDNALKNSSSDSDSDCKNFRSSKIRKKNFSPAERNVCSVKKKKYNIWCNEVQTEVLTNSLVDCNVDISNERERDVESYNYKLGISSEDSRCKESNFNEHDKKIKYHLGKRNSDGVTVKVKNACDDKNMKYKAAASNARNILSLSTTPDDNEEDIAKDIANKLCEEKEELILSALIVIGKEPIISLFEETRKIEKLGGMLVMNGTRRRTPGGVFFYLLKTSDTIPRDKINLVLSYDKKSGTQEKKLKAKKMRQLKSLKFKEALSKHDFPTLLSRTEIAIKEFKARKLAEDSAEVKNPPPSPATDGKDNSSDGEEQKHRNHSKYSEENGKSDTYNKNSFENEDTMEV